VVKQAEAVSSVNQLYAEFQTTERVIDAIEGHQLLNEADIPWIRKAILHRLRGPVPTAGAGDDTSSNL
jgi:hypothetical protein